MLSKILLGVGPWIIFSLVLRYGTTELITISWISFFVLHTYFSRNSLKQLNPLAWVSSIIFVALFFNSLFSWYLWGMMYGAQICYGSFAITAITTVIIKKPFTITHSKQHTPAEFWEHPFFLLINSRVSLFWGLCFAVNGSILMLENLYPWLSLITTYVVLTIAIVFSELYPTYFREKAMQAKVQSEIASA